MFESSQKATIINRFAPIYIFFVLNHLSETFLLPLAFQIPLLPDSPPLVSLRRVDSLPFDLVVGEFAVVDTAIDVLHDSFAGFLALEKLTLVDHTFLDFLLAKTMRFGVLPLP